MTVHKNTRLLPYQRKEIFDKYHNRQYSVTRLSTEYQVSRVTIYKTLDRVRGKQIYQTKSINKRFRMIEYGIRRLARIEEKIQKKLKQEARRYNKSYPGEMVHVDTRRLPLLTGESRTTHRYEYLLVGIDDYSRELYANIYPNKRTGSAKAFLDQMLYECPYIIECIYSDNGKEYKGNEEKHVFMKACLQHDIDQRFTRVKRPQTNGKAERVIRTLMNMWHTKETFRSREERKRSLNRFINFYNQVKPHAGINKLTPMEKLIAYFFREETVNNA